LVLPLSSGTQVPSSLRVNLNQPNCIIHPNHTPKYCYCKLSTFASIETTFDFSTL
jgi:hypothetical protein